MKEKFRVYGERSPKATERELFNRKLSRIAAEEGMVLLKNEGVLPLQGETVALFGNGARLTVKGGSGSGDVHERYSVNVEDGLKNNGISVVTSPWLERFSAEYEHDKKAYVDRVEEAIKGYKVWNVMAMFQKIGEFKLAYPTGDKITKDDVVKADVAMYVIARQAGEGDDRKLEKGDYLLSDLEKENIDLLAKTYRKVILVINAGSIVDIAPIEHEVQAIVYLGQPGEEGGNALGEIVSGKVSPSGKLTDTWGRTYADYPTAAFRQDEKLEENYYEGIYVGYRYFEAKGHRPLYPFGYGLSYTTFNMAYQSLEVDGSFVRLRAKVTNVGTKAGKEVAELYLARPNRKLPGEKKFLVAYKKTKVLQPGEEEEVTLAFDLAKVGAYDEKESRFFLEEGSYGLYLGGDVLEAKPVAVLFLKEDIITEIVCKSCPKKKDFVDLALPTAKDDYEGLPVFEVEKFQPVTHSYDYPLPQVSPKVQHYLDTLSNKELARLAMGGGYFSKHFIRVPGAAGNTTSRLLQKGIPPIIMSDGPAGINLLQNGAVTRSGMTRYIGSLPEQWQWGWLKKWGPKLKFLYAKDKDIKIYQYCTAWPNATLLAMSWNDDLLFEVGRAVGTEMRAMGVTLWLAPALNIHRDPLCGRNFEYYSEDPLISGHMARSITMGVQSVGGVGVTIKHFACNNRENNRMEVSSNLSERALREIYLRGFHIAIEARPWALMSSYNRINGVYAADNRDLLVKILRNEWGYEGLVMSDWDGADHSKYESVLRNGNNMIMPGRKEVYQKLLAAIKDGRLDRKTLLYSAAYALNLIFAAATSQGF